MSLKETDGAIVCAGRVYCDLIFTGLTELPRLGEETYAKDLAVEPGGGGFITAANLSALGHKTMLLAPCRADLLAQQSSKRCSAAALI